MHSVNLFEMHSVTSRIRCLILMLLLATGCQNKAAVRSADTSEDGGTALPAANGNRTKKSLVPVKRDVKTIEGNWVVVVTNQRTDDYRWIIKFVKSPEGKYTAEFLDTTRDTNEEEKPKIVSAEIEGDAIRLNFANAKGEFNFIGSFQQGFIRGTIRSSPKDLFLTRLLPTDASSLEPFDPAGLPPAADIFKALMENKELKPEDILNAAMECRTSPIAQDLFAMLIAGISQTDFDESKVRAVIDSYLAAAGQWGDRWQARAEMNIAVNLINVKKLSRMAIPLLNSAEAKMGEDPASIAEGFANYRDAARIQILIEDLASSSLIAPQRETAVTELTGLLQKQRYNPEILVSLATEAEKTGQNDQAMEYLSEVVALPMLELVVVSKRAGQPPAGEIPSETLKKLFTQKNGSDEGYAAFVDAVYQQKINEFLSEAQRLMPAVPTAVEGHRTVLVELFTGMQSPPCVPADLALTGIGKTYSTNDVIVIRHHQHIPGPDGLVNQESEERGAFYEVSSTPTILVDGMMIDPRFYSGQVQMIRPTYSILRQVIDPMLAETTEIKLEMSAEVKDGQLEVSVVATGVSDELLPSCRLRMAVVENEVRTIIPNASNGVRNHEYLVREMLGDAKGIPPKKGELKYSITMPISDVEQHVVDYIKRFETGRRIEFPPEMKPAIQGPLSLVAWVQNDKIEPELKSKRILQAKRIPISGYRESEAKVDSDRTETAPVKPEVPPVDPAAPVKPATPVDPAAPVKPTALPETDATPAPPALPE